MTKIDDICAQLPKEAATALEKALTTKDSIGNGWLLSASKVADLITTHTPWSVSKDAVLNWRRKYDNRV